MTNIKIFENDEFGEIRTVTIENDPWFVGKDIAMALGYGDTDQAIRKHVQDEDKLTRQIDGGDQKRNATVINESGLYALIFGSKLESAKRFKHWVTSEVLPSIRKTGVYQKPVSALEQLRLTQQSIFEVDEKITAVDEDLQTFKRDMPILGVEESRITAAVKKKGVECLGGKESEAYKDRSLRGRVYSDIYSQLKREFGVDTYKAIQRRNCDKAVSVINEYHLPIILKEEIEVINMSKVRVGHAKKPDPLVGIIEGNIINAGITKKILAKNTGIPYSTLCKRLNTPSKFRRCELKVIFKELGMTEEEKQRIPW